MGLFSGSSSRTDSQSSSFDRSNAASVSGGAAASQSDQRIAFEDVFARLFGGAEGAAAGLDPSMLTEASNYLFGAGQQFVDSLRDNSGISYMEEQLNRPGEFVDDQIAQLQGDIGRLFNEELLPGITADAVGGGQLGGGRQGVAEAGATRVAGELFADSALGIRLGDQARRDTLAGSITDANVAGAQTGLAGMTNLAAIADLGFGAGLSPYERLAGILGGPTTLTSAASSSADFARSISSSYGQSQATSRTRSKSIGLLG